MQLSDRTREQISLCGSQPTIVQMSELGADLVEWIVSAGQLRSQNLESRSACAVLSQVDMVGLK